METLRETIKNITRNHLAKGSMIMGQCLSAVGWVNNTVPDVNGVVELPMTDVAGADFAVGAALTGIRPMLVIRFQDFLLLNSNGLVYFAAKRKEIFQESCPLWVRAIGREGRGTGNSHSGKLHSTFMHFPGIRCYAPMTPLEYINCWNDFLSADDPAICFEHQDSFDIDYEMENIIRKEARITLYAISKARLNAVLAVQELEKEGIICNLMHIYKLKPLELFNSPTRKGLVIDTGYETCSIARDIAYQLMLGTENDIYAMGLLESNVGCRPNAENLTPSVEEICDKARYICTV